MISSKKLIKMAKKWQKFGATVPPKGRGFLLQGITMKLIAAANPLQLSKTISWGWLNHLCQYMKAFQMGDEDREHSKKLIKLAKKWQKFAAIRRNRISFPSLNDDTDNCSTSSAVSKGHFVVYTADQMRFVVPLSYLENEIIRQLLNMSEEVFGLPSDGPITLPCDAAFMNYIISLLSRGLSKELENALLISFTSSRCSLASLHQEGWRNQELYSSTPAVNKGHFAVYTADQKQFLVPLTYLKNEIIRQLLNMSEEEFGLPSNGPITLPCDAVFMDYIISLLSHGLSTEIENALLISVTSSWCSLASLYHGWRTQELLVC
nr:auxin-responsive protein SAUR68-like [Ipomoea batatas]